MPYPHRVVTLSDSPSSKWAAAASVSESRRTDVRSPFQKDSGLASSKFPALRTRSIDHPGPADPRRAWVVQPTRKFDDTDEEAQSPMVTSHNGNTPALHGIPPAMTSSLCSTNGDEPFTRSSGTYKISTLHLQSCNVVKSLVILGILQIKIHLLHIMCSVFLDPETGLQAPPTLFLLLSSSSDFLFPKALSFLNRSL